MAEYSSARDGSTPKSFTSVSQTFFLRGWGDRLVGWFGWFSLVSLVWFGLFVGLFVCVIGCFGFCFCLIGCLAGLVVWLFDFVLLAE